MAAAQRKRQGTVRIIGGEWRGRRLAVPDLPGLRPTGDRGRETLFNWLQPFIRGAVCADLFAGSGALGMEAASRGAARVVLVEKSARAARVLRASVGLLNAAQVEVVPGDALEWLAACPAGTLDIAFVDPPFGQGLETAAIERIHSGACMKPGGHVYLETARNDPEISPPASWEIWRQKVLGEVRMQVLKKI